MGNQQPSSSCSMYIYVATSPSGKQYVGQTHRSIAIRWKEHQADALDPSKDKCKALNRAIRKYGVAAFNVQMIACCLPWLLDEYEEEFILALNTLTPHGYNIKIGGSSGRHNEATKEAIRAKLVGKSFSLDTLQRRGQSKKAEKSLPMHLSGWYRQGQLVGVRVIHSSMKEKRFSLSRNGGLQQCTRVALEYLKKGMQFNDSMAVGGST